MIRSEAMGMAKSRSEMALQRGLLQVRLAHLCPSAAALQRSQDKPRASPAAIAPESDLVALHAEPQGWGGVTNSPSDAVTAPSGDGLGETSYIRRDQR